MTKEPTFHEDGVETRTCARCNLSETRLIPELSTTHTHDFSGKEVITKAATCTEEGSKQVYCTESECGQYVVREIGKIPHTPGEEESICTRCQEISKRALKATGHSYGEWKIVKAATVEVQGEKQAVCQVCGDVKIESIPKVAAQPTAPGHDEKENGKTPGSGVPATGDTLPIALWLGLMVIAAGSAIAARKRAHR